MAGGIQQSLKDRGVRMTRQRRVLLDLIDNSGKHLDAETLYRLAKEKDSKLNRVTVYRTLKMLKQGGLVDELDDEVEPAAADIMGDAPPPGSQLH